MIINEEYYSWVEAWEYADALVLRSSSWDRAGLEKVVREATDFFEGETGVNLPHNIEIYGPYVRYPRDGRCYEKKEEIVRATARFAGWLKSAAEMPLLVKLIEKTTSPNGCNSPATTTDLWHLAKEWPSPGRLVRYLRKVVRRTNQILEPYGLNVSWKALGISVVAGNKAVGKAARRAAAETIRHFSGTNDGDDVEVLVAARGMKNAVSSGDVEDFLKKFREKLGDNKNGRNI